MEGEIIILNPKVEENFHGLQLAMPMVLDLRNISRKMSQNYGKILVPWIGKLISNTGIIHDYYLQAGGKKNNS